MYGITRQVVFIVIRGNVAGVCHVDNVFAGDIRGFRRSSVSTCLRFKYLVLEEQGGRLLQYLIGLSMFVRFGKGFLALIIHNVKFQHDARGLKQHFVVQSPVKRAHTHTYVGPSGSRRRDGVFECEFRLCDLIVRFRRFFGVIATITRTQRFILTARLSFLLRPIVRRSNTDHGCFRALWNGVLVPFYLVI